MVTIRRQDWKKALVMLKKGETMDAFQLTGEEPAQK
jgi:ribosomal protein L23